MKHHVLFRPLLLLLFGAYGSVLQAQPSQVQFRVADVATFVRLNAADVNFRRLADASSGKLMEWNSDDGSYYTETALYFSDRNPKGYRADANTGAYVSPYHVAKGALLPVTSTQGDWLRVEVTSGEQSEQAYLLSRFCEQVSVPAVSNDLAVPAYFSYDGEGQEVPGPDAQAVKRTKGQYRELAFNVAYAEESNALALCFPFSALGGKFTVVHRAQMEIQQDEVSKLRVEVVKDYGMDDEEYEVLRVTSTFPAGGQLADFVRQWMLTCPDNEFAKIVQVAFPGNGEIRADEAYFRTESGRRERVSVDAGSTKAFRAVPCTLKFSAQ